jgi:phosphoribosylformylglycinamidine synthase subunit PurL
VLNRAAEAALQRLLGELASRRLLASAHDLSDGGLAVALVEATLAGDVGATVELPAAQQPLLALVSESASRVLVAAAPAAAGGLLALAGTAGVPAARIGASGGDRLVVPGVLDLPLGRLRDAYEGALPSALGEPT